MESLPRAQCAIHDVSLAALTKGLDAIAATQSEIQKSQATMAESLLGLRREMEVGFRGVYRRQDATNGRVTTLEADSGKIKVNLAAQEAFTPGLFKAVDDLRIELKATEVEMRTDVKEKNLRVWEAVDALRQEGGALAARVENDEGFAGGAAKVGLILWAAILAIAGGVWAIWSHFHPSTPGR